MIRIRDQGNFPMRGMQIEVDLTTKTTDTTHFKDLAIVALSMQETSSMTLNPDLIKGSTQMLITGAKGNLMGAGTDMTANGAEMTTVTGSTISETIMTLTAIHLTTTLLLKRERKSHILSNLECKAGRGPSIMRDASRITNLKIGVTLILLTIITITKSEESMTKKKDTININSNRVLETIGTWGIKSLAIIMKIYIFKMIKRGHYHPTPQNLG